MISVYTIQCGLDDIQKDNFYDSLIIVLWKSAEKEMVIIGDFKGHIERTAEVSEGKHGCYGYTVKKKEREKILGFYAAMDMTVGNRLFKRS